MRIRIPHIGDRIVLSESWTFHLDPDHENASLWALLQLPGAVNPFGLRQWFIMPSVKDGIIIPGVPLLPELVTLLPGTILEITKIYPKTELAGSIHRNKIYFKLRSSPNLLLGRKVYKFWAKIDDANHIEFDYVE